MDARGTALLSAAERWAPITNSHRFTLLLKPWEAESMGQGYRINLGGLAEVELNADVAFGDNMRLK